MTDATAWRAETDEGQSIVEEHGKAYEGITVRTDIHVTKDQVYMLQ